ncbi:MAG TPA: HAMP domain-containing sensor histidine kinase [Acetobacteraceae bacterium]|nr:HAMP domain-containing sensor histidine kinase [Acetobacteraceae bacterium]
MPHADVSALPPRAARAPRHLSRRLAWLAVAAVLIAEAVFFLPSLARARRDWLERRLRAGQLAAMSASLGTADERMRAELLRLAGVEAVTLEAAGITLRLARPGMTPDAGRPFTPDDDTILPALGDAVGGLFRGGDQMLSVHGPSALGDAGRVTVLVHRADLDRYLAAFARRVGAISLIVAAAAAVLLYAALVRLLVHPLRRLTDSIAAFRADPERAAAFEPIGHGDDEIAVAGRELAAMQRELRAALWRNARLAALGTAVAKISHDLRGILSPALLTAERLQMSQDASIKRAGDTLVRAVERATELVRRTVEFAREIPVVPARQRMALCDAVAEAAEQTRAVCPDIAIENAVPDTLEIDADWDSVVRILANLMRNAGEAQARRLEVAAGEEGGIVAVTVGDDGPGLPPPVQEALFRPFVSGGRPGSTGLGLAIVHDLVRAHGGEVTLTETGPSGTRFRLTLPRAARPHAARAEAPAGPAVTGG